MSLLARRIEETGCGVKQNEPMRLHTSFRIGGAAELFAEPSDACQALAVRELCRREGVPFAVIGNGSNLLVSDEGVRGVVLAMGRRMSGIVREGDCLRAGAGATLSQLCTAARREGLSGLEFAWGIPGSVGGAVCMNAGAYGGEMTDVVRTVSAVSPEGELVELSHDEAQFGYRSSRFQQEGWLVTGALFALRPGDPSAIAEAMNEIFERRKSKQPLEYPSAGSAFKRPQGAYAAALIEQCGLKGFRVGDAEVSEKHAGFVINRGNARCADVLALCEAVKKTVLEQTGFLLEMEIKRM